MKNFWPDDGGLKEPVRSLEETQSAFWTMMKKYFSKDKESA